MGLTFRPGDASWSYGGYGEFRRKLARYEGIRDLDAWWKNPLREDEHPTPLEPLLNSPDDGGFFWASQCRQMLPRLLAIMEFHEKDFDSYDLCHLELLIEGMEHCAQHGCAMSWG